MKATPENPYPKTFEEFLEWFPMGKPRPILRTEKRSSPHTIRIPSEWLARIPFIKSSNRGSPITRANWFKRI